MHLKMETHLVLILVTLVSALVTLGRTNDVCTPQQPQPGDKPKPTDGSYSAEISGKLTDIQLMQMIKEYYDQDKNKLAAYVTSNGGGYIAIANLKTMKYTVAFGEFCFEADAPKEANNIKDKGARVLDLEHGLLEATWVYDKTKNKIKGVSVDCWSACMTSDFANFTADYYYKAKDSTPFRLELTGTKLKDSKGNTKYHRVFDYFMYTKGSPKSKVFRPPPGLVCAGMDNQQTTPPVPPSAYYRQQEIDPVTKHVDELYIYYDTVRKISTQYHTDGTTKVLDFSRGMQFTITPDKKCRRDPFHHFENNEQVFGDDKMIHMASMKRFFLDDGNFTYNGQRKVRGIKCDSYTKRGTNAEEIGISLVTIHTAQKGVVMHSDGGSNAASRPIVRIVMKKQRDTQSPMILSRVLEMYDFWPGPFTFPPNHIDLQHCFNRDQKINFIINLQGATQFDNYWMWNSDLKANISQQITQLLGISFLRLDLGFVLPGDGQHQIMGKLYDREKSVDQFERRPFKDATSQPGLSVSSDSLTLNDCATDCTDPKDFAKTDKYCSYFTFNRQNKQCNLYYTAYYKEKFVANQYVDTYQRTWRRGSYDYNDLNRAWTKLLDGVAQKKISFTDPNGANVIATDVTKVSHARYKAETSQLDSPLTKFQRVYIEEKKRDFSMDPAEQLDNIRRDACARRCLNSLSYNCEAFTYYYKTYKCSLYDSVKFYDSNIQWNETYYQHTTSETTEDLYLRRYSSNFDYIPGQTILSKSDTVFSNVKDYEGCAKLCMRNKNFYCESFEMCGNTCLLGRKHYFDVPKSGGTSQTSQNSCQHFSRNYIQDYTKVSKKKALSNSNAVVTANIDVKQCAQMCSTSFTYNCDVFEYCDADSTCRVSTRSVGNFRDLDYQTTGSCDLYTRKQGTQRLVNFAGFAGSKSSDGGHSPGSMGGIAIGMILVGAVLIIVIALVALKMKSSGRFDNISVGFSKKRLEEEE